MYLKEHVASHLTAHAICRHAGTITVDNKLSKVLTDELRLEVVIPHHLKVGIKGDEDNLLRKVLLDVGGGSLIRSLTAWDQGRLTTELLKALTTPERHDKIELAIVHQQASRISQYDAGRALLREVVDHYIV